MSHVHIGPPDRACSGCIIELSELADQDSRRFWRRLILIYLVGLLVLAIVICRRVL